MSRVLPPPLNLPTRWLPATPLPAYRFVPGVHPHPFRHPEGHMYTDGSPPEAAEWISGAWREDRAWLWGIDLFNNHFFWESHEAWEAIWHQVPRDSPFSWMLQALIQAAASVLKQHIGHERASSILMDRSIFRLRKVAKSEGESFHGLNLPSTIQLFEKFVEEGIWPHVVVLSSPQD